MRVFSFIECWFFLQIIFSCFAGFGTFCTQAIGQNLFVKEEIKVTEFLSKKNRVSVVFGDKITCIEDNRFIGNALFSKKIATGNCSYHVEISKLMVVEKLSKDSLKIYQYCIDMLESNKDCAMVEFMNQLEKESYSSARVSNMKEPVTCYYLKKGLKLILLCHYGSVISPSSFDSEAIMSLFLKKNY